MGAPKGNQYWKIALKSIFNGRPRKYETAKELEARISDYFLFIIKNKCSITLTGLILHCGFNDNDSMTAQGLRGQDFLGVIKRARTTVANYYEHLMQEKGRGADIFALKQFGWTDQLTIDQNINTVSEVIVTINKGGKTSRIKEGKIIPIDPPTKALGSK